MSQPPKRQAKPPQDEEAQLDQRIRALLGKGPEDYSQDQWRGLREHARLPLLYPGQFVAYRDIYHGEGNTRRLVRRAVMRAAPSLAQLHEYLAQLPEEEQRDAQITFVEKSQGVNR